MGLRFLLTNDDGIDAPGLSALAETVSEWGEIVVVAPHVEHSGCGHRVTVDRPLHLQEIAEGRYRLDGTPADCVRVALTHLELKIDYVLAGINPGGNLGADVYMSGTVAAVREAAFWDVPGIAISQYRRSRELVDWRRAAGWTKSVLPQILAATRQPQKFWNINLPDPPPDATSDAHCPPIVQCGLDTHPLAVRYEAEADRLVYRGRYQERRRSPHCDVALCFDGAITISELMLG